MQYDVIIIGAGIAGISAAVHLLKLNPETKILLADKAKFPRNKLCAGYLTEKSVTLLKNLDLDINKIAYHKIRGIRILYKGKTKIQVANHGLYYQKLADRSVLDDALFSLIKQKKLDIIENIDIDLLLKEESSIVIDKIKYYYKHLIFADGELGYSARFSKAKKRYFTLQLTFPKKAVSKIDMYFGITKKGYAWYATSGEYVNLGLCDIFNKKTDYHSAFRNFCKSLGYENELAENKIRGFFVPYGVKKHSIPENNIYFIGDAAGCVDPLTLAGISYALISGEKVAESINKNNKDIYANYLKKVKRKFFILKMMQKLLYNPLFMLFFIRIGGFFFKRPFSFILDKFVLNKKGSFHD